MRAIIIGAGRGSRLMHTTADTPKCFAEVAGRRILDWTLSAFHQNDVHDVVFIGGYRIESVTDAYPQLTFRHNHDWPNNNILASLFYAEDLMSEDFLCCYSDILFTPKIVADLLAQKTEREFALAVDTDWLTRYETPQRTPLRRRRKKLPSPPAPSPASTAKSPNPTPTANSSDSPASLEPPPPTSANIITSAENNSPAKPFREAPSFEKAYLIHLLQDMIEAGHHFAHVDTPGGYIEVDTQQDFDYARQHWVSRHLDK